MPRGKAKDKAAAAKVKESMWLWKQRPLLAWALELAVSFVAKLLRTEDSYVGSYLP